MNKDYAAFKKATGLNLKDIAYRTDHSLETLSQAFNKGTRESLRNTAYFHMIELCEELIGKCENKITELKELINEFNKVIQSSNKVQAVIMEPEEDAEEE